MTDAITLDVRQLRLGLHVHLELGWMQHPFPLGSFRIASEQQLQTLRGLGLERVKVLLDRSADDAVDALVSAGVLAPPPAAAPIPAPAPAEDPEARRREARRAALEAEKACALLAERRYAEAGRGLRRCFEQALSQPQQAREQCEAQVHGFLEQVLGADEMAIRLISETAGDRGSLHAVNVTVIALLLGQQLGLDKPAMFDLGVGSMLHDVGKIELPERVRWVDPLSTDVTQAERQFYQEHVAHGVSIGQRMGLAAGALLVIAQHHELADGSGFPQRLRPERTSMAARIVALVNRYDKLCNPSTPANALTPHEALALMYGQMRSRFDAAVFTAFIRMMGVYPPGSVVQLNDDRYAIVLSVNAARPLKPRVLVHDARGKREDALPLDLEAHAELGIRRSLKPQQLPRASLEFLSPRPRVCYFFEQAREPFVNSEGGAL
ncbi:MAG TPA: HD domain-containing phosphohydrolase [Methylibium sp.]|nr:HD domain-containing phosphohydrolase [Methylibium sp.]